jgi:DNA-binding Xre family transcriptional regulator
MSAKIGYRWHLRRLMAERDMFATTDLVPLLLERGITLSREQVYRMVTGTPQRLSLSILVALCDILACQPGDLVESVAARPARKATVDPVAAPLPVPLRARVSPGARQ